MAGIRYQVEAFQSGCSQEVLVLGAEYDGTSHFILTNAKPGLPEPVGPYGAVSEFKFEGPNGVQVEELFQQ